MGEIVNLKKLNTPSYFFPSHNMQAKMSLKVGPIMRVNFVGEKIDPVTWTLTWPERTSILPRELQESTHNCTGGRRLLGN